MADNRLYSMVRAYASAAQRTRKSAPEAIASVVRKAKKRAAGRGEDVTRSGEWSHATADFLLREYSPVDSSFGQDRSSILDWLDALEVSEPPPPVGSGQ